MPLRARPLVSALAAAALAGCGGNYAAHSGGASRGVVVADGGLHVSVTFSISETAANIIAAGALIGFLAVANDASPLRPAPMREDRTINEQDCTQPIANRSANLKCR
jgi:hypothetical protein